MTTSPAKAVRWNRMVSDQLTRGVVTAGALIVLSVVLACAQVAWPQVVPRGIYLPFIVVAGFLMEPRLLGITYAVMAGLIIGAVMLTRNQVSVSPWLSLASTTLTMAIMFAVALSRSRLGVTGMNTDAILTELRDKLQSHARVPELPAPWHVDVEIRSAYGQGLAGDFVVTQRSGDMLQIALVDVSGKGINAGTRSLQLSGAFGSLLGAVAPERFLGAANRYLVEQGWDDNFATAVHVHLNLATGAYSIGHAGHPAAAQHLAGSGRWTLAKGNGGCALGILDDVPFPRTTGVLGHGDALLLYTDGLIESRDRPIRQGLDRMLGRADLLVGAGYDGGAEKLVADAAGGVTDDRAAVLIWRD